MPTYEYQCRKCGKIFDSFHGVNEEGPKRCQNPKCKGKTKKLISAGSGLIFKGSGFYITDYKKKSGGESEKSESSGDKKESTGEKKKGESASKSQSSSSAKPSGDSGKSSSSKE